MHIEIAPSPLPEETIYSLVGRILALNGIKNEDANKVLFDCENDIRLADGKFDLARFATATRGQYGNADDIAAAFTNIRFFQQLGSPQHEPTLANLSNGEAHIWRWCPRCLKEDQEHFGLAYWHRTHQLPGTYLCIHHKVALVEANIPYRDRQSHVLHPGHSLAGINPTTYPLEPDAMRLAYQLAVFSEDALRDDSPVFPREVAIQAIRDGLRKMGLVSTRQNLHLEAIARQFAAFYAPLIPIPEIGVASKQKNIAHVFRILRDEDGAIPQPGDTLLLGFWLFREWKNFRNACVWADVMGRPAKKIHDGMITGSPDEPSMRHATPQHLHREVCMAFLQNHPYASRSQFWRAHPKSCRWLNRHDAMWFTDIFPSDIHRGDSQLKLI